MEDRGWRVMMMEGGRWRMKGGGMKGGEWKMEGGGWRMEDGGQRIEGERWRMKEGGRPWEEREAGLWLLLLCPMGALLKCVQVQAGKEWGEFMEGTAGLVPHCLRTPAACNAQDPGSSCCRGPEEGSAQHQQHLWPGSGPSAFKGCPGQAGERAPKPVGCAAASLPRLCLPAVQLAFLLW